VTEVKDIDREAAASVAVLVEMRKLIHDGRADYHARAFAAHREAAEAAERARIVAWLRDCSLSSAIPDDPAQLIADLANTIERGEHLK